MHPESSEDITLHATTVALDGRALLIRGASGSGKSALALMLMAWGAGLVADDRTRVLRRENALWAECPPTIRGRIEARGLGILSAAPVPAARLAAVVDLDEAETERLPPFRTVTLLGLPLPLILRSDGLSFPAGLLQYLKGERSA